jgi:hypothetical protein
MSPKPNWEAGFRAMRRGMAGLPIALLLLAGCARFKPVTHEFVYVSARQVYLHDRVAAVSNRVALATNGEALEVVERGRRFLKVRTPKGEVGWVEEHAVIDDKLYAQYQQLGKAHSGDPVVATAQLRDDLYLHLLPGRETPHFLLVPGNAKVQLLARGTVEKAQAGAAAAQPKAKPAPAAPGMAGQGKAVATPEKTVAETGEETPAVPPVPMEDWWLVRDKDGHTGWLLGGRLDVDIPDDVGAYAEGQRMVAAYPIAKVTDYEGGPSLKERNRLSREKAAKAETVSAGGQDAAAGLPAPKEMTEYVTVLTPPHNGLPYDFDQVRVFTWSLNHHRYETAYRLHGIQGYLPVRISQENVNGQTEPVFSFDIANGPNVAIDPENGITRPATPRTIAFRLEGNIVKRTGADQAPIVLTHELGEAGKAKAAGKKKKR